MKRIALILGLMLALTPVAQAQDSGSVVTRETSDATARAVSDAVSGATQDALKPTYKPYVAEKPKLPANKKTDRPEKRAR